MENDNNIDKEYEGMSLEELRARQAEIHKELNSLRLSEEGYLRAIRMFEPRFGIDKKVSLIESNKQKRLRKNRP